MTDDISELREQVEQLQSQLAFHEDAVASLDAALAEQQKDMLLLRRQIALLHERQAQLTEQAGAESPPDAASVHEKPPHY